MDQNSLSGIYPDLEEENRSLPVRVFSRADNIFGMQYN